MLSYKNVIDDYKNKHLFRQRIIIENKKGIFVEINKKKVVNFCSNDYLNLSTHPEIIAAFIKGMNQFGLGSGASSLVSGYYKSQRLLEEAFSDFLNRERSIFFNSGYHANLGTIPSLAQKDYIIIADKLC